MPLSRFAHSWLRPFRAIFYPNICLVCGTAAVPQKQYVCARCLQERFAPANPAFENFPANAIAPDEIHFQHALWCFDAGGSLQHLLHQLKYQGLEELGRMLGRELGRSTSAHPTFQKMKKTDEVVLLPVPLHRFKRLKRGYNQARLIAEGIAEVTKLAVLPADTVLRIRNTRSQTGFTMDERLKNLEGAFSLHHPARLYGKSVLLVDDVFTTGATTFELSRSLNSAETDAVGILTVARA